MVAKKQTARTKIVTFRVTQAEYDDMIACSKLKWGPDAPIPPADLLRYLLREGCAMIRREMGKKHCWAFLTAVAVTSLS